MNTNPSGDDQIIWEEPPPSARANYASPRPSWVFDLRARPGHWARVREFPYQGDQYAKAAGAASALATRIRKGGAKYWQPAGSFEAVSRRADGAYRVYARYVGEGGAK